MRRYDDLMSRTNFFCHKNQLNFCDFDRKDLFFDPLKGVYSESSWKMLSKGIDQIFVGWVLKNYWISCAWKNIVKKSKNSIVFWNFDNEDHFFNSLKVVFSESSWKMLSDYYKLVQNRRALPLTNIIWSPKSSVHHRNREKVNSFLPFWPRRHLF